MIIDDQKVAGFRDEGQGGCKKRTLQGIKVGEEIAVVDSHRLPLSNAKLKDPEDAKNVGDEFVEVRLYCIFVNN